MIKICPATSNLPTVMTSASWEALCSATFKKETAVTISGFQRTGSESFCSKCRGKIKPPKLKIVSLDEMLKKTTTKEKPMTTKVNNRGTCDCCGDENLVLRNNYEKKMCGKCASMYSNVRNWLPIIEMALADIWPDKYGPKQLAVVNPDAVKVAVDEKTEALLKRIAALVWYEGDDPEEMVEHITGWMAGKRQLRREREDQGRYGFVNDQLARRESALYELVEVAESTFVDFEYAENLLDGYRTGEGQLAGLNDTQQAIAQQCDQLKAILLDKNRKYGNSALEPVRLFSKADPVEQIRVRIDDKLSRLQSAQVDDTEDVETDLAGYLVLLKVAKRAV